ncbi:DUF1919 domain-containing protein [Candidatus Symbiopectobacterium sp. NZEC135]|uniref:DUF1919 domain-containing protein n=1 Tax=Candidatus Symbiopectobacterium sp. NZEC135 TaxID=2820471 RepID=UPI002226ADE3|nr:DUF1919 domain-containing protein [Candidatus Symbiopectobacterium sp. NZEC135]MCW2480474.1 DUF1919 domain-containing protein [Candidatus Symbiopectobacterium sp. NZEC135]
MGLIQRKIIKTSATITKRLDFLFLKRKDFCIVSNNCWGPRLYEILKREYNTPFVGLFLTPEHYIDFIRNIEFYINIELTEHHFLTFDPINKNPLRFSKKYPIACIEGCDIHFLHYNDKAEAISKWNRRRVRLIDYIRRNGVNSLIFKFCDSYPNMDVDYSMSEFKSLPYARKIFFETKKERGILSNDGVLVHGVDLFRARLLYYKRYLALFSNLPSQKKHR